MRKIKVVSPSSESKIETKLKISFSFNAQLVQETKNWLIACWNQDLFPATNYSDLLNQALEAYQARTIQLDWDHQFSTNQRINVCFRFSPQMLNFYHTLPLGKRSLILQLAFLAFYQKKKAELIEKGWEF